MIHKRIIVDPKALERAIEHVESLNIKDPLTRKSLTYFFAQKFSQK